MSEGLETDSPWQSQQELIHCVCSTASCQQLMQWSSGLFLKHPEDPISSLNHALRHAGKLGHPPDSLMHSIRGSVCTDRSHAISSCQHTRKKIPGEVSKTRKDQKPYTKCWLQYRITAQLAERPREAWAQFGIISSFSATKAYWSSSFCCLFYQVKPTILC